jgi:hypothetical protein
MSHDDPTLPDRIHLRTLVEWGLSPMLKREPMEILREMLGGQLPPEPVFVNLTAEQLARCIEAARRVMTPPPPAPPVNVVPVPVMEQRLAYNVGGDRPPAGSEQGYVMAALQARADSSEFGSEDVALFEDGD